MCPLDFAALGVSVFIAAGHLLYSFFVCVCVTPVCVCVCVCLRVSTCMLASMPACVCPQENVSLADILSLRDICLTEQEVWAVCVECVLALQSIASSPLFHTLCITPDTLAFNAHGNVCFMEQLSGESTQLNTTLHSSTQLNTALSTSQTMRSPCLFRVTFIRARTNV